MTAPNQAPEFWPRCPAGCGRLLKRRRAPLARTETDVEGVQMVLCGTCWHTLPATVSNRVVVAWRTYSTDPSERQWAAYRDAYDTAVAEARAHLDAHRPVVTADPVRGVV